MKLVVSDCNYYSETCMHPLLSGHQLLESINFLPIFTVKRTCIHWTLVRVPRVPRVPSVSLNTGFTVDEKLVESHTGPNTETTSNVFDRMKNTSFGSHKVQLIIFRSQVAPLKIIGNHTVLEKRIFFFRFVEF